jgi:hypothetical protein
MGNLKSEETVSLLYKKDSNSFRRYLDTAILLVARLLHDKYSNEKSIFLLGGALLQYYADTRYWFKLNNPP